MDSHFTVLAVQDFVDAKYALGKDSITWQMLRNLSEPGKEQLKEELTKLGYEAEFPLSGSSPS